MGEEEPYRFAGFVLPQFTQMPNALVDELLPRLSEAELKVLLYIIRRTFGFHRDADAISTSQLIDGIVTREGERLDYGTGLSKSSVRRGVTGLLDKEIITVRKIKSPQGDYETNVYALRFRTEHGVVPNSDHPRLKFDPGVVPNSNPQKKVEQNIEAQDKDGSFESSKDQPDITLWEDAEATVLDYLTDYAREFHDQAPLVSSHRRAMNLYRTAGLDLDTFLAAMQTARAKTKLYSASIRAEPVGEGLWKQKPRMAYWFSILEELIGSPRRRVAGE